MKTVAIWESTTMIAGGTRVSLAVYDALRHKYRCIVLLPGEGQTSEELKRRGISYEIIPEADYSSGKKGIKDIIKLFVFSPYTFIKLYRCVRKNNIRMIYSNAIRNAIPSAVVGRMLNVNIIWHIHHYFQDNKSKLVVNKFGSWTSIKKIMFVSQFVCEQFPELWDKSLIVYNGIDVQKINNSANQSTSDIDDFFKINRDRQMVAVISHVMSTKKQEIFIRAIPHVMKEYAREDRDKIHFLVVGEIVDQQYLNKLRSLVEEMGLKDMVTFWGYCPNIPRLLNYIDANVISSVEGLPIILLECMAAGVPVILPRTGGGIEALGGRDSLVYELGNEKDLAEKTLALLRKDNLREETKKTYKERAEDIDIHTFHNKVREIVDETIQLEERSYAKV